MTSMPQGPPDAHLRKHRGPVLSSPTMNGEGFSDDGSLSSIQTRYEIKIENWHPFLKGFSNPTAPASIEHTLTQTLTANLR